MLSEEESIKIEKTADNVTKPPRNDKEIFFLNKYKDSQTIESQNIDTLDTLLEKEKTTIKK